MKERWGTVKGFSNYQISSEGRIYNLERDIFVMPQYKNHSWTVNMKDDNGIWKTPPIGRMVATAFLYKPKGCDVVSHIDGDIKNNLVDNLMWAKRGRHIAPKRRVYDITDNVIYDSPKDAAFSIKSSLSNLYSHLNNKSKTCVGHELRYI